MSLQLHRPDGRGGIEHRKVAKDAWRRSLISPRWGSARRGGKLPDLANPEMNPTPTWLAVLFWVSLAAGTFVVLVGGYSIGVWK
jgi:hypothetical protein